YNQAELIAIPAEGWEFDSWSGDMEGTDNPAHLIIDSHKTITAIFKQSPLYTLTVNTQGEGSVRINKTGYNQAELIAIPAEGWEFDSWSGDMEGNSNPEILVIDIDKTVVAIFKMVAYHLTAIVDGGNGTITPEEATCSYSTIIWLTATPDKGYRILSWSGTDYDSSKENINRVTIYSDRLVMVKFIQISDMDRDFLSDTEEHGPSGDNPNYDGNGDGIPDYLQDNVVSMHNYNGMHYITLASSDLSRISDMEAVDPNSIPENIPDGVSLELGLFSFIITSLNADGSTNVKFYLDPNLTRGFTPNIYYKFGPTPDNTSDHWYPFSFDGRTGSIITGNTISLFFIDGERGDDDMTVNGIISDIGGPAFITISQQEEFLEEEDRYGCFITCLKYKPKRGL
ncbi:hypothetical protein JXL19_08995, partial [bacterium]|nr:hypothetical protein [bacterium]